MKIIILGCGRVGAALAGLMCYEHHEVVVIDSDSDSFRRLDERFTGQTLVGDGTDEDVLRKAGLSEAEGFAAVTNGDNRNIMAAQIAKYIFKVPRVLCRIYDPIRQETYNSLGLESISPTIVGAKLMRDALASPIARTKSPAQSLAEGRSVPLPLPQQQQQPGPNRTGR